MEMEKTIEELLPEVRLEDLSEGNRQIVEIIGLKNFIELSKFAKGERLYLPKPETIVIEARNRKIKEGFNGRNYLELAGKYNLTTRQIRHIIKDEPIPGQIELNIF